MKKISLQIDTKAMRLVPAGMMAIFAMQTSLSYGSIEMYTQSYILLGLALLSACIATFLCLRQKTLTKFDLCILGLFIVVFASSLISSTDFKNWIYICTAALIPIFLFRYYKEHPTCLLLGALFGFTLSIYIGFIDLLSKPELWMTDERGVASGYLLGGNYNQMGPIFISATVVNLLAIRISKWFLINFLPLIAVSLTMLFIVNSSTAISGMLLLLLISIIPSKRIHTLAIFGILTSVLLFEIFVCFQGKGFENNELARWLIIDILGKDMTFTYRTDMWDSALRIIKLSPIYGYGYPDAEWYYANMSSLAIGPHNAILGILIYGGLAALILYISSIYIALREAFESRFYVTAIAFSILSLMMLFEIYSIPMISFILILVYNSPSFANIKTSKERKKENK